MDHLKCFDEMILKFIAGAVLDIMLEFHHEHLISKGVKRKRAKGICDAARYRFQKGNYGLCVKCETKISDSRLEDDPAEMLCADCAMHTHGKAIAGMRTSRGITTKDLLIIGCSTHYWYN